MSVTKDGFYNIEGKMFEVIRGVEGDCLTLGDEDGGTRISGPKPWGGGRVVKTFVTCEKYGPIEHLEAENAKLREELAKERDPQRIGGQADPSSFVYAIEQLREFRWQHATNDEDAIPYINNVAAAHERENAKLRKLAGGMYGILATFDAILGNHDACETPRPLIFGENKSFKDVMRELGIEVGE